MPNSKRNASAESSTKVVDGDCGGDFRLRLSRVLSKAFLIWYAIRSSSAGTKRQVRVELLGSADRAFGLQPPRAQRCRPSRRRGNPGS